MKAQHSSIIQILVKRIIYFQKILRLKKRNNNSISGFLCWIQWFEKLCIPCVAFTHITNSTSAHILVFCCISSLTFAKFLYEYDCGKAVALKICQNFLKNVPTNRIKSTIYVCIYRYPAKLPFLNKTLSILIRGKSFVELKESLA